MTYLEGTWDSKGIPVCVSSQHLDIMGNTNSRALGGNVFTDLSSEFKMDRAAYDNDSEYTIG